MDLLRENPQVSFCVAGRADLVPEEFTTKFESVILFGKARTLETREEKLPAMTVLCKKYSEPFLERLSCMKGDLKSLGMIEIIPERITGKRSLDL